MFEIEIVLVDVDDTDPNEIVDDADGVEVKLGINTVKVATLEATDP